MIYTNIIKLESLFVRLNALIFGTSSPIWKIIFEIDCPIFEEGFIRSREKKGEQKKQRKIRATLYNQKRGNRIEAKFSL